jgi:hypothetical protein
MVSSDLAHFFPPQSAPFPDAIAPYMAVQAEKHRDWPHWKRDGMLVYLLKGKDEGKIGGDGKRVGGEWGRGDEIREEKGDVRALPPVIRIAGQKNWDVRVAQLVLKSFATHFVTTAQKNEDDFWKNRQGEKKALEKEVEALSMQGWKKEQGTSTDDRGRGERDRETQPMEERDGPRRNQVDTQPRSDEGNRPARESRDERSR